MSEKGKVGCSCLSLTRPGAGVFICELNIVRNKYSTHNMRRRGRKKEKTNVEVVLLATDPHCDEDEGQRCEVSEM